MRSFANPACGGWLACFRSGLGRGDHNTRHILEVIVAEFIYFPNAPRLDMVQTARCKELLFGSAQSR
jgi:hypothetical protein